MGPLGWSNPDVYSQPEVFGLEPFGGLDEPDMSYEFHMLDVWLHRSTGDLYWAEDWGCSCPSPYENYTSLDTLTKLDASSFDKFNTRVTEFPEDAYDKGLLVLKVRKHLGL